MTCDRAFLHGKDFDRVRHYRLCDAPAAAPAAAVKLPRR
jgi:hypothetical protein